MDLNKNKLLDELDDLLIIADEKAPRNSWLLGRIVKTFPVRKALVKTKSSTLLRPIHKLCLLMEASHST